MTPDIVQLPLNIFDQRAINTGWLVKLNDLGIEIHARSVFMQGILLTAPAKRPAYFRKWDDLFKKWDYLVAGKNTIETCFGFIKSIRGISKVIVGVESQKQLGQLLFAWDKAMPITAPQLSCEDEGLVHPYNWRVKLDCLGVIGMSDGNGHPYSWSAICNGYSPIEMATCGFPVISEYLSKRAWPEARLPNVEVSHVWTQDPVISRKIARSALIPNIVEMPEKMIGEVDGILLARDDQKILKDSCPISESWDSSLY